MPHNKSGPRPKRTLRQSLKAFLQFRLGRTKPENVGSGILRRLDQSASCQLPQFSAVSLFPDFGASDWDVRYQTSPASTPATPSVTASSHALKSKQSLLPATSLSQFNLHQAFTQQGQIIPHRVIYETVADGYLSGLSRQASLASLPPRSLHKSVSTLRIRESTTDLRSSTDLYPPCPTDHTSALAESPGLRDTSNLSQTRRVVPSRWSSASSSAVRRRSKSPLTLVEHFQSFCVLDTAQQGYPVTATSDDLRYIFDTGEKFLLNNVEVEGTSMDIVTGTDAVGNPVTHLVLFSPLMSPSSGRARFMLALLIDVTPFIEETATLTEPELDTISEEDSILSFAEAVSTPPPRTAQGYSNLRYELSCEDLLGGCSLDEPQPSKEPEFDIWLDIAVSEGRGRNAPKSLQVPSTPTSTSAQSTTSSAVDDVLESFVSSLQSLYSDFFLLGKSALDDNSYEICNVSPNIFEAKEFVSGHLSRSPVDTIEDLSASLTQDSPFTIKVNWGADGEPKQLYCAPLYGQRSLTWICFLVDAHLPMFW